jgi:predicted extracellular nuclease
MRQKPAMSIFALSAALLLSSCGYTKIGKITADPTRYRNQTVRVEGRVTNSFGALSMGGYQIQDETGKIFVLSNRGVPSSGSKVAVNGTVVEGVTVMGRSFGTTIQEHDHQVRGY